MAKLDSIPPEYDQQVLQQSDFENADDDNALQPKILTQLLLAASTQKELCVTAFENT